MLKMLLKNMSNQFLIIDNINIISLETKKFVER